MASAPFVQSADAALRSLGLEVSIVDLDQVSVDRAEQALDSVDLIFFTGGYALCLLQHVRRTGLAPAITDRVNAGDRAYVGISAGAALAGPDLALLSDPEDPGVVDTTEGLGLVPFVVLAHRGRGREEQHDLLIAAYPDQLFVSLTDSQAIVVEDGGWEVRSSPDP
jgi:dipeptidase E